MLALSVQWQSTVTLTTASGEVIKVTLAHPKGNGARVLFDAPKSVRILRDDAKRKHLQQIERVA